MPLDDTMVNNFNQVLVMVALEDRDNNFNRVAYVRLGYTINVTEIEIIFLKQPPLLTQNL